MEKSNTFHWREPVVHTSTAVLSLKRESQENEIFLYLHSVSGHPVFVLSVYKEVRNFKYFYTLCTPYRHC